VRRRCAFRLIRALLAVASVIAAGLITTPSAAAVEPVRLVDITLTSIKPALPTRDGTITLTGRVRNITDQRLYKLRALFWRNEAPITTREGLDQAINSESNDPIGRRLFDHDFQDLYTTDDPYLEPNQTVDFRLKVEVADLALSADDGIYLMGVHVLQDSANVAIGRSRIFVPMVASEPERPLKMTAIAILDSRPSTISKGLLSDDHLAGEISSKGRLTALLDAVDDQDMTFAVDPALIEELQSMRSGYQVRQPDGSTVAGTGQAAAADWLDDFADLKEEQDGYRLLFGSPDLAALTHDGQRAPIRASVAANKQVGLTSSLPLLVFPAGGAADAATMARAVALNPKAVLLADTTAKGDGPLLAGAVVEGKSTAPIVSYTISAAGGGGPGPDPRNTAPQIQQRFLAETWIQATTATDDSTQGRVRVITTAAQARGDDSTVDAPWLEQGTLTELLDTVPKPWNQKFRYPAAARSAELTNGQLHSLNKLYQSYQTYADALVDGAAVRTAANAAVARAASSNWRRRDEERRALLMPQQAMLDDILLNKIRVSSSAHVSTVAQEGVVFPITVQNDLDAADPVTVTNAVRLELVFNSVNSQRLSIDTIEDLMVPAQDSVTVNAEVTAKANGTVPVKAQLMTESGREVGRPFTIDVQVTQNGTTGWAIAIGAGLVLAGSTALRIRQVSRERARSAPTGEESVLTSAPPADDAGSAPGPIDVSSSSETTAGIRDV
jgi:hypothetical protein